VKKRRSLTNIFLGEILILGLMFNPSCSSPTCIGWEFNKNGYSEGWQARQDTILEVLKGYLTGDIKQPQSFWIGPADLSIDAVYKTLKIKYRINSSVSKNFAYFYWIKADDIRFGNDKRVKFDVQTDNTWQEINIDLAQKSVNWNGIITGVHLYPTWNSGAGTSVDYDYIRLCK